MQELQERLEILEKLNQEKTESIDIYEKIKNNLEKIININKNYIEKI